MHKQRILVTGGAGFIGSHAVDALLESGCEVVVVDNLDTGNPENLTAAAKREGFRFEFGDIAVKGRLERICRNYQPDAIIHLAGLVSVVRAQEDPSLNFRLNVEATQLVAEAARATGVKRIVFASSAAVYGEAASLPCRESGFPRPSNLYGAAKSGSEQLLFGYADSFGIETICLRFFNVFGPRQDPSSPYSGVLSIFADRFLEKEPVRVFGDGSQTRDFIAVADVARAITLAATRKEIPTTALNVCTGEGRSLLEVMESLRAIVPGAPDPLFEAARPGDILHSRGCPDRARELLGFQSEVTLDDGLRALLGQAARSDRLDLDTLSRVA